MYVLLSFVLCVAVRSGETGKMPSTAVTQVQSLPLLSFHRLICAFTLFHKSQKPPEASVKTGRREWDIFRFLFFTISTSPRWCNTPECAQKRGDETQSLSLCTKPLTGEMSHRHPKIHLEPDMVQFQLFYDRVFPSQGNCEVAASVRFCAASAARLCAATKMVTNLQFTFWECARLNVYTVITSQTQSAPPYLHFPWQCFCQLCARAVHGDVCEKMKRSKDNYFV